MSSIKNNNRAERLCRRFFSPVLDSCSELQDRRQSRSALLFVLLTGLLSVTSTARADDGTPPPHKVPSLMGWLASGGPTNPMEVTRLHAAVAATGLNDQETGPAVQEKQKQVVAGLDAMIKTLEDEERKKKQGNGPGGPNPTKPASKSTLAKGPGGSGPLHDDRGGADRITKLDDKQRDQIQKSTTEGFPAGYDSVLSNYYARLAQEGSAGDAKPAPVSAAPTSVAPTPVVPKPAAH